MRVAIAVITLGFGFFASSLGTQAVAAGETEKLKQTQGECGPVIVGNSGKVSITCSAINPRALRALEDQLTEQARLRTVSQAELTRQAELFARRYQELESQVEGLRTNADKAKMRAFIEQGDFRSAEAMVQDLVTKQFGQIPVHLTFDRPSIWQILASSWQIILMFLAGLYALAFTLLLLLTHRSAWAFRVLSDAVWAKWLTWPFFFLRHMPAVQRWVFEPWFQAIRRTIRTDVHFLDPSISTAAGPPSSGVALLARLHEAPRLWLHGRAGMGKSSVFAAWERAFFAGERERSLGAAVGRYGFIPVMLQVRRYAALQSPESSRPEAWVLEAVRRRLEQFGLAMRDLGLVDAMLKAGHIALVLDGANEADREFELTSFAQQFRQVPLLITSQSTGGEDWEVWHLPEDVGAMRDGLLGLWLGPEKAAVLSHRIAAEELSDFIVSGYDLRLLADLAGPNPESAVLPQDRIALYRAMLARGSSPDGQPLGLDGLKQLAWTMVIQRRRQILAEDEKLLGAGVLTALMKEGVRIVRQIGTLREFRHDQMRAFLAALWLVEETPNVSALENAVIDAKIFALNRKDQEELWRFLGPLIIPDGDLKALWSFANEEAEERVILLAALQDEADRRDVVLVRAARRRKRKSVASQDPDIAAAV